MIPDFLSWLIIENKEKEDVFEISKQYQSKTQFKKYDRDAYNKAFKNGWLNDMNWLTNVKYNKQSYCVYVYIDEENSVAYVGLTVDKKRRHKEHKSGYFYNKKIKSPVFEYFTSVDKEVPEPIYLEENLTSIEAQEREDYWIKKYVENGYILLNKGRTGKNIGSLGGVEIKWTKEKIFAESQKYYTIKDFREYSHSAYNAAKNKDLIKDMYWLKRKTFWTKEMVFEESKKYKTRGEFQAKSPSAYDYAYSNSFLDEMSWLKHKIAWDKEKVFDESKKYKSRGEFQDNCCSAYDIALRKGWLDEMTWLKPQRKSWNFESVKEESKKYKNKFAFRKGCIGAYKFALRNGMLDDLF